LRAGAEDIFVLSPAILRIIARGKSRSCRGVPHFAEQSMAPTMLKLETHARPDTDEHSDGPNCRACG
jgi:hypothetical protein